MTLSSGALGLIPATILVDFACKTGEHQELLQSVVVRPTASCRLCGAAELGVEVDPARCAYCTQIRPPFLDIAAFSVLFQLQ